MKNKSRRSLRFIFYLFFLLASGGVLAQTSTINGTVFDNEGFSLPGVTIMIEGTSTGTITDQNGNYSISVPGPDAILLYSFVGFVQKEEVVGNRTIINTTLMPSIELLGELVVSGLWNSQESGLNRIGFFCFDRRLRSDSRFQSTTGLTGKSVWTSDNIWIWYPWLAE